MPPKLVSRAEFCRLYSIDKADVTRLTQGKLAPCLVGKKMDLNHPCVAEYLAELAKIRTKQPVDDKYLDAVEHCRRAGKVTVASLKAGLSIGQTRAVRLIAMMKANGLTSENICDATPQVNQARQCTAPVGVPDVKPAYTPGRPPAPAIPPQAVHIPALPPDLPPPNQAPFIDEHVRPYLKYTLEELINKFGTMPQFQSLLAARKTIEDIRQKQLRSEEVEKRSISKDFVVNHFFGTFAVLSNRLLSDTPKSLSVQTRDLALAGAAVSEIERVIHDNISSHLEAAQDKAVRSLKELSTSG